mgnify:CR=1 FL=1
MRRKLKDIGYMKKAAYDIGGRMADEYIRNFNRRETESAKPKEKKEMKNSLTDLNNYLFEQLERLLDDEICSDEESTKREIAKACAITDVANSITNNATVQLNAMRFRAKLGLGKEEMPQMLLEKR